MADWIGVWPDRAGPADARQHLNGVRRLRYCGATCGSAVRAAGDEDDNDDDDFDDGMI
ncbi:MAG: hypothetical protein AAF732_10040 [Pseudomonadota bacterium]